MNGEISLDGRQSYSEISLQSCAEKVVEMQVWFLFSTLTHVSSCSASKEAPTEI